MFEGAFYTPRQFKKRDMNKKENQKMDKALKYCFFSYFMLQVTDLSRPIVT